jgi:hypothetical protein
MSAMRRRGSQAMRLRPIGCTLYRIRPAIVNFWRRRWPGPPAPQRPRRRKNSVSTRRGRRACRGSNGGPYLSERQWGTVPEDYSDNGDACNYFTHDQARSPITGAKTGSPGSATITSGCAFPSPCGTARTRSSRSGCSAQPKARAITGRTSRSIIITSTVRRPTRTRNTFINIRRILIPTAI